MRLLTPSGEVSSCMSKGTRREREWHAILKAAGHIPYRPATVQYGENDVFGLYDVLSMRPFGHLLRGWQVKSNGARGIETWARNVQPLEKALPSFYAVPYDNEGWRVDVVRGGSHTTLCDEREMNCRMGEGVTEWLRSEL